MSYKNIRITEEVHHKLKVESAKSGKAMIQFINDLIDEHIKREEVKND